MSSESPAIDRDAIRDNRYGPLDDDGLGEFICPECNRRCTRGPSGTEYGHARGATSSPAGTKPCPRRPGSVDPRGPQSSHGGGRA